MDLKQYLEKTEMSQTAFAAKLGISQAAVNRYVKRHRNPSLRMALQIESVTGKKVPVASWLLSEEAPESV